MKLYIVYWLGSEGDRNCEHLGVDHEIAQMAMKVAQAKHPRLAFTLAEVVALQSDWAHEVAAKKADEL